MLYGTGLRAELTLADGSSVPIVTLDVRDNQPVRIADVYALLNRIRLTSSQVVVDAGDEVMHRILERYFSPKVTPGKCRSTRYRCTTIC